jgi:hypothetical protein
MPQWGAGCGQSYVIDHVAVVVVVVMGMVVVQGVFDVIVL